MKKLALIFGSIFGLLVLIAIVVPLVVDVDKYRPVIISKANENLNGKLELGKLNLSLWGQVLIKIDGLKLSDANGVEVVAVKDASFKLPLLSLLTGRPEVRVQMLEPLINVVKGRNGKLNVMSLAKAAKASDQSVATGTQPSTAQSGNVSENKKASEVPLIVLNSRLTLLIKKAKLAYVDQLTNAKYNIDDFNFRLEDVSLAGDMPFEVSANLNIAQGETKVVGPLILKGDIKATSSGGDFEKASARAKLSLDGLEIVQPGVFNKKKGVALSADLDMDVGKDSFKASKIKFRLGEVAIDGEASGRSVNAVTEIDFKAQSNTIDVAKLGDLSPIIGNYGMNGLLEMSVQAKGPTDHLGYGANLKFNKVTLSNDALKQPVHLDGALLVATNEIKELTLKMGAKDFDFNVEGGLQNFLAPKFKFKITSNRMDLDGLLKASEKAAQARKEHAQAQAEPPKAGNESDQSSQASSTKVVDYNAMFEPLRKNPIAAASAGTIDFNLKSVKSTGVTLSNVQGELALNNLLLALRGFSMGIFDGSIKGDMSFNTRPAKPEVGTKITVSGLQTQKMVESSMPLARNTVKGVVSANLNIGGPGLNHPDIVSAWKGNGNFDIKKAFFSTLDVGKQIRDGALAKLPEFIRSKVKVPDALVEKSGEYEVVGSKFALSSGTLTINEVYGKAYPNKGLDLKGNGSVKLANYALDMNVDIIDTYNLLHGDEIAKDNRYGHFALGAKLGGTLFSPRFDWSASIGRLAENAVRSQAKDKLQQAIGDKIPGAGNLLNKVFGGGASGGNSGEGKKAAPSQAPKPADAVNALKGLFGH